MPTENSLPQTPHYVNPPTRAQLRERLLQLRFRLLQPLPADEYWRIHDEAEELATMLAGPVRAIDPRCEAVAPPVYYTREDRIRLLNAMMRFTKDSL